LTYNGGILKNVVSEPNPKKLNVAPGIKGLVDKFHEVFSPGFQDRFISLYYLRSVPVGVTLDLEGITRPNPSKDSDYLVNRRLVASSFNPGEIPGDYKDEEVIKNEIIEKEREIRELDIKYKGKEENYEISFEKQAILAEHIANLKKQRNELLKLDEDKIFVEVIDLARVINRTSKTSLDDLNQYAILYPDLQDIVKKRLLGEGKINNDQAKNWTIENSNFSGQDQDPVLRNKSVLVDAEKKRADLDKKTAPHLSALQVNFYGRVKDLSKLEE